MRKAVAVVHDLSVKGVGQLLLSAAPLALRIPPPQYHFLVGGIMALMGCALGGLGEDDDDDGVLSPALSKAFHKSTLAPENPVWRSIHSSTSQAPT